MADDDLSEAQERLEELVDAALRGAPIIVAVEGVGRVQLVPVAGAAISGTDTRSRSSAPSTRLTRTG